jgi:hypothetical protein
MFLAGLMDLETLKITGSELKHYAVRERVAPVVGGEPIIFVGGRRGT